MLQMLASNGEIKKNCSNGRKIALTANFNRTNEKVFFFENITLFWEH